MKSRALSCLLSLAASLAFAADDGFTPLFDGKTMAGWKNPYEWGTIQVVNGEGQVEGAGCGGRGGIHPSIVRRIGRGEIPRGRDRGVARWPGAGGLGRAGPTIRGGEAGVERERRGD